MNQRKTQFEIYEESVRRVNATKSSTNIAKSEFWKRHWLSLGDTKAAWDRLMERTDYLHDLDCGVCDEDVIEFQKFMFGNAEEQESDGINPLRNDASKSKVANSVSSAPIAKGTNKLFLTRLLLVIAPLWLLLSHFHKNFRMNVNLTDMIV